MKKINTKKPIQILNTSYEDYIDARLLILNDRLFNGGHLSALAVEKLMKALIGVTGNKVPRKHLDSADVILNSLGKVLPDFKLYVNEHFIKYLGLIYSMRYLNNSRLKQISISRNKLLWELDRFVEQTYGVLKFSDTTDKDNVQYYKSIESKDRNVLDKNFWLSGYKSIEELKDMEDYIELVAHTGDHDHNMSIQLRKYLPNTFVNCRLGEEVKLKVGIAQV